MLREKRSTWRVLKRRNLVPILPTSRRMRLNSWRGSPESNEKRLSERFAICHYVQSAQLLMLHSQVDWRLIPVLAILYLMSHLDRANIGNANIEGLSDDLGLSGTQYNVALCIFFISYILFGTILSNSTSSRHVLISNVRGTLQCHLETIL